MVRYIVDNKAGIVQEEKTVLNVFEKNIDRALKDGFPLSLYIAVGFFFFEGFQKIYPKLRELHERGLLKKFFLIMGPETRKTTKEILEALKNDASILDNEAFNFIKELYGEGKFEFRIFLDRNFHIKLYIFEVGNDIEIWVGSANLTEAGLEENIELIVPVDAPISEDKQLYKTFFSEIWKRSTDKVEKLKVIDIVKEASAENYLYLSPREFFAYLLKILKKERLLENIGIELDYLGKFQRATIDLIMDRMEKYGGCILANSVGLGKTDTACAIIKYYIDKGNKVLLIIPPILEKHWKRTLERVGIDEKYVTILSRGLLQKADFNCEKYSEYQLIVVDEAHHFRVSKSGTKQKSNRRKNLEEITKINENAHVLLITATPINISLVDLTSLIKLFERGKYLSAFEEEGISYLIKELERKVKKKEGIDENLIKMVRGISEIFVIRFDWLDIIKHFREDLMKIAGVNKVEPPEVEKVEFEYKKEIVNKVFDRVVDFLAKLNYEYTKLWEGEYKEDKNLIWWYKWRLYKRLESSLYAFKRSLEKMKKRNEFLIKIFLRKSERVSKTDLFSKDRLETILNTFSTLNKNQKNKVIRNMKEDIKEIEKMLKNVETAEKEAGEDSKLEQLLAIIKKENKPMLIFSESRDTVIYICKFLKENGIKKFTYAYGGGIEEGEEFYGEHIKELDKDKIQGEFNEGKYNIIVSTDILAEGINLPRADIVINFDLPYNPVKLIQRDGRALRLNNPKKIKIYNFVPEKSIDKELELFEKLKTRVELILAAVGLDFVIWSVEEGKLKKFSDKHRKRAARLIREWKELLATRTPEELKSRILTSVSKENKILKEFAEFFGISRETLEIYNRIFKKPIYTCFKSEKEGYWVVFKNKKNYLFAGELQPTELFKGGAKGKITRNDENAIGSLVKKEVEKRSLEILKTPKERDKISREIEKLLGKYLPDILPSFNSKAFSEKEKKEILSKLRRCENAPLWREEVTKKEVRELILRKVSTKYETEKPQIIAVIKYVKV